MPFDNTPELPVDNAITEQLKKGYARIEHGWCKNILRFNHQVCALGALGYRHVTNHTEYEIVESAYTYLWQALPDHAQRIQCFCGWTLQHRRACDIADYNNADSTTHEDVLRLFRHAIELSRE